jgi:SPW repeat-containing protein
MLRQGPISLTVHALLEPVIAALLIAAPFLFGFSDEGAPTAVAIIAGLGVLVVGLSTRWRFSLVKAIPISVHLTIDLVLGGLLIAAPFLFGFSDHGAATAFFLVMGVGELLAALGTRWTPGDASGSPARSRGRRSGVAPGR